VKLLSALSISMDSQARRSIAAAVVLVLHLVLGCAGQPLHQRSDGQAAASPAGSERGGAPAIKPDAGTERQQAVKLALADLPPPHAILVRFALGLVNLDGGSLALTERSSRSHPARAPPFLSA
jgi:hypothetical protein